MKTWYSTYCSINTTHDIVVKRLDKLNIHGVKPEEIKIVTSSTTLTIFYFSEKIINF